MSRSRKTRIFFAFACLMFVVLAALIVRNNTVMNSRQERGGRLQMILKALEVYEHTQGALPAAVKRDAEGRALSSWRFQIIYLMRSVARYSNFDAAWNSEINSQLRNQNDVGEFCQTGSHTTTVYAVTGEGTAFPATKRMSLAKLPDELIVLCEVADSNTHWMAPGDFDRSKIDEKVSVYGVRDVFCIDQAGFWVAFADCEAWFLSPETPFAELRKFFTIEGAKKSNRNDRLRQYCTLRLARPGSYRRE